MFTIELHTFNVYFEFKTSFNFLRIYDVSILEQDDKSKVFSQAISKTLLSLVVQRCETEEEDKLKNKMMKRFYHLY